MWWNDLVDARALLLALWRMDPLVPYDCRSEIGAWLPLRIWSRCEGCGVPLVYSNHRGSAFASREATHALDMCSMCYFTQQC